MTTATELRDIALDQVTADHSWADLAEAKFEDLNLDDKFTGEDIRLALTKTGLPPPHHHNAWGAFTMRLVRAGLIRATGDFVQMITPQSHARITRQYQKPLSNFVESTV